MKIKALRDTFASGLELAVGDIVDVSEQDGNRLINSGKAEKWNEALKVRVPGELSTPEPETEVEPVKPKRKRKSTK